MQCPTHGVKQVRVPWAEPRSRFTLLMERLVIDLIRQCSTVKGACEIAGVSWDEAWGMMSRAVARGPSAQRGAADRATSASMKRRFRKGHRYHTVVCDLERSTVEFVAEERKTASLAAYYAQLTEAQKTRAAGGGDGYVGAVHRRDARRLAGRATTKIVFDRFHIMRDMTKAVDTVRKQEHRAFLRDGDDSPLTGTKYVWLFSDERRPERTCRDLRDAPGAESESRSRVGDQRSPAHAVDLPPARGGEAILHPLVRLGRPLAARSRQGRRGHAQASSRRCAPVRRSTRSPTAWPKGSTARS